MVSRADMVRMGNYIWEIPASFRSDMKVPARIYASEKLLDMAFGDRTLEQLVNTAAMPGVVKRVLVMPDAHQGYGPPIGGVVATRYPDGVISPGAVGYDINCGVRLMASELVARDVQDEVGGLISALFRNIPSGVGKGGTLKLRNKDFDRLLHQGAKWAVKAGYARPEDVERTEESGRLDAADAVVVAPLAQVNRDGLGVIS